MVATILIAALIFYSCGPAATFDKPQPDNLTSLAAFPPQLQGNYLAADHASVLTITDKLITRHYDYYMKELRDSLGPPYKLAGDTLINQENGTREIVLLKGDTIMQNANWMDTLFNISNDNILKKFKGYYFLNNRYYDHSWEVKNMKLKRGLLSIGSISTKEDIQKLKEITETTADTVSTHFSLTRRQFKRFIKQEGFGDQETFTRITGNNR